jgi:hypothetical protein
MTENHEIFLSQGKYTVGTLKKFSMTKCKPTVIDRKKKIDDNLDETDSQLFGSLMYLVNTRLDSCHTVNGPDTPAQNFVNEISAPLRGLIM